MTIPFSGLNVYEYRIEGVPYPIRLEWPPTSAQWANLAHHMSMRRSVWLYQLTVNAHLRIRLQ